MTGERGSGGIAMQHEPREYEPPKVVDYGTLIDLTASNHHGQDVDKNFPNSRPQHDMTFS